MKRSWETGTLKLSSEQPRGPGHVIIRSSFFPGLRRDSVSVNVKETGIRFDKIDRTERNVEVTRKPYAGQVIVAASRCVLEIK